MNYKPHSIKPLLSFVLMALTLSVFGQGKQRNNFAAFVPKGYVIFEKIYGDVNNDNLKDCILIIKATDESKIVIDDYEKKADRNRRGIIVLLNHKGNYTTAVKNYSCFSSENEDGGNYMPPELSIEIKKGKMYVHYAFGRYGYWRYTFKFSNSDFQLIGYESSDNHGSTVDKQTSINFLTKTKLIRENINRYKEDANEVFKETRTAIKVTKLITLSTIEDFEELEMNKD